MAQIRGSKKGVARIRCQPLYRGPSIHSLTAYLPNPVSLSSASPAFESVRAGLVDSPSFAAQFYRPKP